MIQNLGILPSGGRVFFPSVSRASGLEISSNFFQNHVDEWYHHADVVGNLVVPCSLNYYNSSDIINVLPTQSSTSAEEDRKNPRFLPHVGVLGFFLLGSGRKGRERDTYPGRQIFNSSSIAELSSSRPRFVLFPFSFFPIVLLLACCIP